MKARRQAEILAIIQEYDIETQDQLLEKLREKGMKSTQATISRDIKELHLVKELTGRSTYKYTVSERKTSLNVAGPVSYTHLDVYKRQVLSSIIQGVETATQQALVRYPGLPVPVSYTHLLNAEESFSVKPSNAMEPHSLSKSSMASLSCLPRSSSSRSINLA